MSIAFSLTREWHWGQQLGAGGFGQVFEASSPDQPPAVGKFIRKDPGAKRKLLFEELEGLPNVVPVLDRGQDEENWILESWPETPVDLASGYTPGN